MEPARERRTFPPLWRERVETLQVNLGYRCNQACLHCHVAAGPSRTEEMLAEVVEDVLRFLEAQAVAVLDVTGGAPAGPPVSGCGWSPPGAAGSRAACCARSCSCGGCVSSSGSAATRPRWLDAMAERQVASGNAGTLAVMAKAPIPGFAKTRLIPRLGPEGAAELHAVLW